jgi:hypothetical protein
VAVNTDERTDGGSALVDVDDDDQRVASDDLDAGAIDVPEPPHTGDPGVDEALDRLARAVQGAPDGPLDGQVGAYDAAHRTLQDRLADVES